MCKPPLIAFFGFQDINVVVACFIEVPSGFDVMQVAVEEQVVVYNKVTNVCVAMGYNVFAVLAGDDIDGCMWVSASDVREGR